MPSWSASTTPPTSGTRHETRRRDELERNTARINTGRQPEPGTAAPTDFIYYIRVGDHIKIGYSSNLAVRLSSYPPNSELLATELGDKTTERARHRQFSAYLAWGREWFIDSDEIRNHIATLPPLTNTGRKRMRRGPANEHAVTKPRYWR